MVDLAGSEGLIAEDDSSERVTDLLHVMKSLSAYVLMIIRVFSLLQRKLDFFFSAHAEFLHEHCIC